MTTIESLVAAINKTPQVYKVIIKPGDEDGYNLSTDGTTITITKRGCADTTYATLSSHKKVKQFEIADDEADMNEMFANNTKIVKINDKLGTMAVNFLDENAQAVERNAKLVPMIQNYFAERAEKQKQAAEAKARAEEDAKRKKCAADYGCEEWNITCKKKALREHHPDKGGDSDAEKIADIKQCPSTVNTVKVKSQTGAKDATNAEATSERDTSEVPNSIKMSIISNPSVEPIVLPEEAKTIIGIDEAAANKAAAQAEREEEERAAAEVGETTEEESSDDGDLMDSSDAMREIEEEMDAEIQACRDYGRNDRDCDNYDTNKDALEKCMDKYGVHVKDDILNYRLRCGKQKREDSMKKPDLALELVRFDRADDKQYFNDVNTILAKLTLTDRGVNKYDPFRGNPYDAYDYMRNYWELWFKKFYEEIEHNFEERIVANETRRNNFFGMVANFIGLRDDGEITKELIDDRNKMINMLNNSIVNMRDEYNLRIQQLDKKYEKSKVAPPKRNRKWQMSVDKKSMFTELTFDSDDEIDSFDDEDLLEKHVSRISGGGVCDAERRALDQAREDANSWVSYDAWKAWVSDDETDDVKSAKAEFNDCWEREYPAYVDATYPRTPAHDHVSEWELRQYDN